MLNQDLLSTAPVASRTPRASFLLVTLVAALGLSACGQKESKPGQSLASVDGTEITVLQLNEELQRAGVSNAQKDAASKQLLAQLVDRQLLVNQATKDKLDRDPKVLAALERSKAMILAEAYLQKQIGTPTRPSKDEVAAYYEKNPQFFANRKVLEMRQLVLATQDLSDELKAYIDGAKNLDEVANWLEQHQVKFARGQANRTTADLPVELSSKLINMPKGQMFIVREGERSLLISIADIKDAAVTLEQSAAQIEQFLTNQKSKQKADAELVRLRAAAKIDYLNGATAPAKPAEAKPAASAEAAASGTDAAARGVAGLK